MTLGQALAQAAADLNEGGIPDARLEAEILLRHALNLSRVQLYQSLDRMLIPKEAAAFQRLLERRLSGEPAAYITGHREFYGLDFLVDRRVLIPRPETELLVDKSLEITRQRAIPAIADIGTGSGAIAVSLAVNLPQVRIYAVDISVGALALARINAARHGVSDRISFLSGNLLEPLPEPVGLITANLPYVTGSEVSSLGLADFEPELALDGGSDGLERIRELIRGLGAKLLPGGSLLLEIGLGQAEAATGFLQDSLPETAIEVVPDLAGIDRMINLTLPQD